MIELLASAVHAASSCPSPPDGCGTARPHMCRNADGTTRNAPHPARRALAEAIEHDRVRASIGLRTHLRADRTCRRRTAWDAGRAFDREQAQALRRWLRRNGSILWSAAPARTIGGTL